MRKVQQLKSYQLAAIRDWAPAHYNLKQSLATRLARLRRRNCAFACPVKDGNRTRVIMAHGRYECAAHKVYTRALLQHRLATRPHRLDPDTV